MSNLVLQRPSRLAWFAVLELDSSHSVVKLCEMLYCSFVPRPRKTVMWAFLVVDGEIHIIVPPS